MYLGWFGAVFVQLGLSRATAVETAVRYPNLVEPKQPQTTPDTARYHSQPKTAEKI